MALSRFALTRKTLAIPTLSPIFQSQRHRSGKANQGQLIEVDLDSSLSSSPDGDAVEVISGGVRNMDEVLQNVYARQVAPDWLPFLPGYSYWVPPTDDKGYPGKFIEVVGKFSAAPPSRQPPLAPEESLSFTSSRGWPSTSFFIEGVAPSHPVPMELEVEVKIFDNPVEDESGSEDEEG